MSTPRHCYLDGERALAWRFGPVCDGTDKAYVLGLALLLSGLPAPGHLGVCRGALDRGARKPIFPDRNHVYIGQSCLVSGDLVFRCLLLSGVHILVQ